MDASEVLSSQGKPEAIPCQFAAPDILLGGVQWLGFRAQFLGLIGGPGFSVLGLDFRVQCLGAKAQGCSGCCHCVTCRHT